MWVETGDPGSLTSMPAGNLINLDTVNTIKALNDSGTWRLSVLLNNGSTVVIGAGYASEADAQDVARKVVSGVDPSTY